MKAFYDFLGDVLARPPGSLAERLTPFILALLGGLFLLLAASAWLHAPGY